MGEAEGDAAEPALAGASTSSPDMDRAAPPSEWPCPLPRAGHLSSRAAFPNSEHSGLSLTVTPLHVLVKSHTWTSS